MKQGSPATEPPFPSLNGPSVQLSPGLNRGAIFSLQGVEQPARGAGKVLGNHNGGYYGPLPDA